MVARKRSAEQRVNRPVEEILAFPTAGVRSLGRRAMADLTMLEALHQLREQVDEAMGCAVQALIEHHGATWTDVAERTGLTRQGATKRWGTSSPRAPAVARADSRGSCARRSGADQDLATSAGG